MNIKKTICIALTLICIFSLCSCGKSDASIDTIKYDLSATSISNMTVASNSDYELVWNDEGKFVMLKSVNTGKIWSNIPYEFYVEGETSANVSSTLTLTVANATTLKWESISGYKYAYQEGKIIGEQIEDGVRVIYNFPTHGITIPVEYTLEDFGVSVSVDTDKIIEGKDYLLVSFAPAPFLCSAQIEQEDSYLFVPTGTGALMYAAETPEGVKKYTGEVFGIDASRIQPEITVDEENIYMPVFGAKEGSEAIFGIITEGAETVLINAETGNKRTGYARIYPDFYVRGYDVYESGVSAWNYLDITRISETFRKGKVSVSYHILSGENADYNGMANCYKKYLAENNIMTKSSANPSSYSLSFLGGLTVKESVFGIPVTRLKVLTDYSDVLEIVNELTNDTSEAPNIRLLGFGSSGINVGKLASGFKISNKYGSKKEYEAIEEICSKDGKHSYVDFDIINFSSSGKGFSYMFDSAKSATLHIVERKNINIPLRDFDTDSKYRILKRKELPLAAEKLIKNSEKEEISAISLSSLSQMAYSDYTDENYFVKDGMGMDVSDIFKTVSEAGFSVACENANSYAAAKSDVIFDVPDDNGQYMSFDAQIPFYQMVFGNDKVLYSEPINQSDNIKRSIMLSAIGGSGLGFTVCKNFDLEWANGQTEKFYTSVYSDQYNIIKDSIINYKEFFDAVSTSEIEEYRIISNDLSATYFANGVVLYANHSSRKIKSPIGELTPYEFKWEKT